MKKRLGIFLILVAFSISQNLEAQENWTLSMTGFDQTYSPADFATASNGDIYLNGVKYDSGVSGFVNKLYKSTDQGASWVEISTTGLIDLGNVHSLTFSGSKMLLAGMNINSANGSKIFVSVDNGSTWTLSMTGFDQTYSPADFTTTSNGDIYLNGVKYDSGVSGFANKLYKSTDQGASWVEVSTTGLTDLGNVHSLIFSGSKMLLAGMNVNSANGAKIFVSAIETGVKINNIESITNIRCFPNPFDNELEIDIVTELDDLRFIKIFSSTGETIYFSKSVSENRINTANLVSGLYFLMLEFENKVETIKLVKKN